MRLRTARYLIPLLLSGVGLTSLSAMAASLTPLAPVINGSTHVNAVSGDGQTAGGSSTNSVGNPGPAAWGHGASPIITGTWLYNSSFAGQTYAVSNDGSSYAIFLSGFNDARVVRGGAGHWLYGPDGSANGVQTAFGLSGDGDIVVGRHGGSAAYWTYLGPANGYANAALMPTLSGNSTAYALGLDGTVAVGTSLDANATQRAVVWTGTAFGTVSSLDPTELYGPSAASAISDDASTIVGYVTDGGNQTAAIWNGTAYGTVGLVGPIGSSTSRAMAVNADGSIVGGTFELQSSAGTYHAFLKSGSAPSADLNDLLTTAGVNMTGIVLADVTGLSDTGHYLAANDTMAGQAYIVFYDGTIAGVSSGAAQVESLTQLGDQRSALLTQPGSYESVLLGDLDAGNNGGSELSAFGLYGSAAFGIKGRTSVGDLTVNAGVMLGTGDYGSVAYDGGLAAASLRYDLSTGDPGLTPFLEAGGSFGLLQNLTFRRSYANGAGTASGIGTTDGYIASTFARPRPRCPAFGRRSCDACRRNRPALAHHFGLWRSPVGHQSLPRELFCRYRHGHDSRGSRRLDPSGRRNRRSLIARRCRDVTRRLEQPRCHRRRRRRRCCRARIGPLRRSRAAPRLAGDRQHPPRSLCHRHRWRTRRHCWPHRRRSQRRILARGSDRHRHGRGGDGQRRHDGDEQRNQ